MHVLIHLEQIYIYLAAGLYVKPVEDLVCEREVLPESRPLL